MARKGDGIYLRGKAWRLDFMHDGQRHQVPLGRNISRSVAADIARVKRAAILKGEAGIGRKVRDISFDDAAKEFIKWARANKRPKTAAGYESCFRRLKEFFSGRRLSEIHPFLIEKYKQKRLAEGAKVAVNRELSRLRTMFNLCAKWKRFEGPNPASRFQRAPESRGRLRFLTADEEQRLLAASEEPLRSLIVLGIHTGLRVQSEGLSLTWACIDFHQETVTVEDHFAKNGETRTVPLNSVALETLRGLRRTVSGPNVFMIQKAGEGRGERRWEPYRSFRTAFETACRRANLPDVTPHVLRHTFASRLVMKGADLRTVQELGGWKSLNMVQRYAHLSQEHKRKAVELLAENSTTLFTTLNAPAVDKQKARVAC